MAVEGEGVRVRVWSVWMMVLGENQWCEGTASVA